MITNKKANKTFHLTDRLFSIKVFFIGEVFSEIFFVVILLVGSFFVGIPFVGIVFIVSII